MQAFVAETDPGWSGHLRARTGPKDANLWRPSTRPVRLEVIRPFLFKLKALHHAIAGFGYFDGSSALRDLLAWGAFGEATNRVGRPEDPRGRLSRIQKGAWIATGPTGRVDCSLIAEATLLEPEAWVHPPSDWKVWIQPCARYDLSNYEGLRIGAECQTRATTTPTNME